MFTEPDAHCAIRGAVGSITEQYRRTYFADELGTAGFIGINLLEEYGGGAA